MVPDAVLWFRRDLRLADHPALLAARERAGVDGRVVALFVDDARLRRTSGPARLSFLSGCLAALDADLATCGGRLVVRRGDPVDVIPEVATEVEAASVLVSADFAPYGSDRDERVESALGTVPLERVGSPYAVDPGAVRKSDGTPFKVYTPYWRAWRGHGWDPPAPRPERGSIRWADGLRSDGIPPPPPQSEVRKDLPVAGEAAALDALAAFLDGPVADYARHRDRPDLAATSRLSPWLKWGCLHPRTILAALSEVEAGEGPTTFEKEVAWREFYADVLFHAPWTARESLVASMRKMRFDSGPEAEDRYVAWCEGRTGYPIVDAGMRQLVATGWMHNRVRMIVASFFVKDLHLDWTRGARFFMHHLVDGDLASNAHGWQWTAGTGTDASPYYRVFNPITQGVKFDPEGDYVRRWVPELATLDGAAIHTPWAKGGVDAYPAPIVDHGVEREEALARLAEIKAGPI